MLGVEHHSLQLLTLQHGCTESTSTSQPLNVSYMLYSVAPTSTQWSVTVLLLLLPASHHGWGCQHLCAVLVRRGTVAPVVHPCHRHITALLHCSLSTVTVCVSVAVFSRGSQSSAPPCRFGSSSSRHSRSAASWHWAIGRLLPTDSDSVTAQCAAVANTVWTAPQHSAEASHTLHLPPPQMLH